ncbi:MAG: peptidylprolyl isomerase [Candidatus Omnitrophota bacterium]
MSAAKRSLIGMVAVIGVLLSAYMIAGALVVDKVLVVVNDEVITQREFDRAFISIKKNIESRYSGVELDEQLDAAEENVLDELIKTKLAVSVAKKEKLEIDEAEVKRRVGTLRSYYKDEGDFLRSLSDKGTNLTELEKDIRDQMLAQKVIERDIASKIVIQPAEIKELYDKNAEKLMSPPKIKVRGIMVRKSDGQQQAAIKEEDIKTSVASGMKDDFVAGILNRATMKKSIEEIHNELKQGRDFATMAVEYSDGPYAKRGGDMGYISSGQVLKEIDDVVFNMKKGEVSDIVETKIGYHVFTVEDIQPEKPLEFSEVNGFLREQLYMRKFNTDLAKWFDEKKQNAYIEYK